MSGATGFITSVANAFQDGGVWMYAIMIVQIVSLAIIAERVYALYFRRLKNQQNVVRTFEDDIKQGRLDRVITKSMSIAQSHPVAAALAAGAISARDNGGKEEIQAKMEEVLAHENALLERRTGFLSMLGNVGTLLGLLGTIVGLIQAFASVANLNAAEKSVLLTQGVALAMNTTAYGLIMAIPALIMYSVLTNRTLQLQEDLNQAATRAYNWLSFNYEATPLKAVKKS
jgi:biopolymer transport protein ExbB